MLQETINSPLWDRISSFLWMGDTPCPVEHDFPKDDGSRILLLEQEERAVLAEYLEALSAIEQIRTTIAGDKVRELKARFPHAYRDVLRLSPYFAGKKLPEKGGMEILGGILESMGTPADVLDFAGVPHPEKIDFPIMKLLKLINPMGAELCSC